MPREDQRWREQENWRATESSPDLCCKKLHSILVLLDPSVRGSWKLCVNAAVSCEKVFCWKHCSGMDITAQRDWNGQTCSTWEVEIQTLQTRKCHVALGGSEGSRASSGTHFTAENVQTTSDVKILKVKEPMNGLCAWSALNPKVNYALVKAALQTVPEQLADGGFLLGSYSTWGILQSVWKKGGGAGNYV